jgi:hypothetical protein
MPKRAMGQASKIVHRAYAKKAQGQLPSLEAYEDAKKSGKIITMMPESPVATDSADSKSEKEDAKKIA